MAAAMDFSESFEQLFPMDMDVDCHSTVSSPLPATVSGRFSPPRVKPFSADDTPVSAKRRRMNPERPRGKHRSTGGAAKRSSPRLSPSSLLHRTSNDLTTLPFDSNPLPKLPIEDLSRGDVAPRTLETLSDSVLAINRTFDTLSETNLTISRTIDDLSDSQLSSPGRSPRDSPAPLFRLGGPDVKAKSGRYRKDELWAAIASDYEYLMDGEIIEQCKVGEGAGSLGVGWKQRIKWAGLAAVRVLVPCNLSYPGMLFTCL